MLKPPYLRYSRIYTYHLDGNNLTAIDDPDLIGIWEEDGKTILIFHRPKDDLVTELTRQNSCRLFYQADLDYADWEMGRDVASFTVGPLTIAPVWDPQKADIKIDPSVVFGNGFHPSTRLCLESLVNYYPNLPENFTALDLGCGSGLLGIGAAKLGASAVLAFDFNPLACAVAKQNAAYNKVANIVLVEQRWISLWPICIKNCWHSFSGTLLSGRPDYTSCPALCQVARNIFWLHCPALLPRS